MNETCALLCNDLRPCRSEGPSPEAVFALVALYVEGYMQSARLLTETAFPSCGRRYGPEAERYYISLFPVLSGLTFNSTSFASSAADPCGFAPGR